MTILEPRGLYTQLAGDWFEQFSASVLELLARRGHIRFPFGCPFGYAQGRAQGMAQCRPGPAGGRRPRRPSAARLRLEGSARRVAEAEACTEQSECDGGSPPFPPTLRPFGKTQGKLCSGQALVDEVLAVGGERFRQKCAERK